MSDKTEFAVGYELVLHDGKGQPHASFKIDWETNEADALASMGLIRDHYRTKGYGVQVLRKIWCNKEAAYIRLENVS